MSTDRRWRVAAVAVVYLTYAVTRLSLVRRMPVFWDEGFHAATAATGLEDPGQRFGAIADGKPPLFSWLAMLLMHSGAGPVSAVRLVAFAAGLLTVAALLWLGHRLGGWGVGLVAATLYVLSPYAFVHDSLGLLDGLLAALLACAVAAQWRLAIRPTALAAVGTGTVMALAVLTRQSGNLAYLLLPLSLAAFDWAADARRRRLLRWLAMAALACAVSFVITRVQELSPYATVPTPPQSRSVGDVLGDPLANGSAVWPGFHATMTGYVGWGVLALAATGLTAAVARRDAKALVVAVWAIGPSLLVFLFLGFGYPRYFFASLPAVVLLAAYGVARVDELARKKLAARALPAARVGVAAVAVGSTILLQGRILADPSTAPYPADDRWQLVSGWTSGTGLDGLADHLREHAAPGTTVVGVVSYTPWNLAALLGRPIRVVSGGVPYQDGARVTLDDGRVLEFRIYDPVAPQPRFVLNHDAFAAAETFTDAGYEEVRSFERPGDSFLAGVPQPATTVTLYELAGR